MNFNITQFVPESVKGFLNGNGTYIVGWFGVLLSGLSMLGVDTGLLGVNAANQSELFFISLSAILVRRGVTNEVKKLK